MMKKSTLTVGLCLLLALLAAPALEAAKAKVEGVVVDQQEKPIAGAVVTVTATDGSAQQAATTNRKGKFSLVFDEMAPGFTIRVEADGFASYEGPVELQEGRTLEVTVPLLSEEVAAEKRAEIAAIEARNKAARRYNEGAEKYNEGKTDEAIALFQEAVEEEEELAIAWAGLGRIFLELERYDEAVEALERYEALEPGREPVLLMLYDGYGSQGNSEKASALLERLIAEFPGGGTAARIFNLGVASIKEQRLEEARDHFQDAVDMHPDLYQAHLNLAQIARAYEDWGATLEHVDLFLVSEPQHARALALRYQSLKNLDRESEAAEALAALRQAAPEEAATIFHNQGVDLFNIGQTQAALSSFLAAIDVQPDHARAHYRAGLCYLSLEDNPQAKAYLEKFVEMAPDDPETAAAKEMLSYL